MIDWKNVWEKTITSVTTAATIAIFAVAINFYINTTISNEVRIEKDKIQQEQFDIQKKKLLELETKELKIETLIDSNKIINKDNHDNLVEQIENIEKGIRTLTFVISKNNKKMHKDILELKELQKPIRKIAKK